MMRSLRRENLACSSFPLAVDPNCTSLGEYSEVQEHGRVSEAARIEQHAHRLASVVLALRRQILDQPHDRVQPTVSAQ